MYQLYLVWLLDDGRLPGIGVIPKGSTPCRSRFGRTQHRVGSAAPAAGIAKTVTARKVDATTSVQAAIVNVAGLE